MSLRHRVIVLLALTGCPQHAPPEPPHDPPPAVGGGGEGLQTPGPSSRPGEPSRIDAPLEDSAGAPMLSAPGGGEPIADTLAPRGRERQTRTDGCQGGSRQAGESWKVECNTCHCGDDGQVTCTVMACNVSPPS
jgi:hypothetical protein